MENIEKVIVAAVAENGTIGMNGDIPWHIPEDLERFREITTGSLVLMGRGTYESLPDPHRPLPDRTNIVLTRSGVDEDVVEAESLEEAYREAATRSEKVFIIGGESVYRQTLEDADRMEITEVHESFNGDTFFPEIDWENWREMERDDREGFSFVTYVRR
ncbi:MAG: dihydrofolate reductase [Candidatus Nanohaloarchaea archaeon]